MSEWGPGLTLSFEGGLRFLLDLGGVGVEAPRPECVRGLAQCLLVGLPLRVEVVQPGHGPRQETCQCHARLDTVNWLRASALSL